MDSGVIISSLTDQEILQLKHVTLSVIEVLGRYSVFSSPQVSNDTPHLSSAIVASFELIAA